MRVRRSSTLAFDTRAFNPQTIEDDIAALRGDWGFELWGWVYLNELMPQHFFRIWVCSRLSTARDIRVSARERMQADRPNFLSAVLVMSEETSWSTIRSAVAQIVDHCEAVEGDDWERFRNLMLRFVEWDDDPFGWGYEATEPEISKSMRLRIPRPSADAQALTCAGSIEVEPGTQTGFSVLACSNTWIASGHDSLAGGLLSSKVFGSDYIFPVGMVVVNQGSDWTEVEPALRQALQECESRAEGDRAYFRTLASRFIVWDGDPFAFRWSE